MDVTILENFKMAAMSFLWVLSIIRKGILFLYKGKKSQMLKSQVLLHVSRHNLLIKILLKKLVRTCGFNPSIFHLICEIRQFCLHALKIKL